MKLIPIEPEQDPATADLVRWLNMVVNWREAPLTQAQLVVVRQVAEIRNREMEVGTDELLIARQVQEYCDQCVGNNFAVPRFVLN